MATLERRSLFPEAPLSDSGDRSPDSIFSALCDERRHSFGSSSSVSIPPPAPHTKVPITPFCNPRFFARAATARSPLLPLARRPRAFGTAASPRPATSRTRARLRRDCFATRRRRGPPPPLRWPTRSTRARATTTRRTTTARRPRSRASSRSSSRTVTCRTSGGAAAPRPRSEEQGRPVLCSSGMLRRRRCAQTPRGPVQRPASDPHGAYR